MHICIVDDVEENAILVRRSLSGHDTVVFTDPLVAREYLRTNAVDILITDQRMPELTGIELIKQTKDVHRDVIAIVVSAYTDREDLIDAVNSRLVFRYLVKPYSVQEMRETVKSAQIRLERARSQERLSKELSIQNRLLLEENDALRAGRQPILDLFAGSDPAMAKIKELALLYALSDGPVLVSGETGTGKELLARIIHHFSPRRDHAFVAVNCSNLSEQLLESTLFGHVKGAFTSADRDAAGLVHQANGGTLFLDEIGDLPPHLQPKLLRFIQFQTFTRVGATKEEQVDVRIVSATNQDLHSMAEAHGFRNDLLYRLNTFQIHLPPLRQRSRDIVPIMRRIARARGSELPIVDDDARAILEAHRFPGNVRELQSVVERLLLLLHQRGEHRLTPAVVRSALRGLSSDDIDGGFGITTPNPGEDVDLHAILRNVAERLIRIVHEQENGNVSSTARRLGLSRQGLRNKLQTMDEPREIEPVHDDVDT